MVRGAVTFDAGKARYCLTLDDLTIEEAKLVIDQVHNTIYFVLSQVRNTK